MIGMKVSEKSLELNLGAELLALLRGRCGRQKTYLRGLTQREESEEGADFLVQLPEETRIFAFQFKAPSGPREGEPYKFRIQRPQHGKLSKLAKESGNVFYVLPYYLSTVKLQSDVPNLLSDTWFLDVESMNGTDVFGTNESTTVSCAQRRASINSEYELRRIDDLEPGDGIPKEEFAKWYKVLHKEIDVETRHVLRRESDEGIGHGHRKNPWLVRGLRLAIVLPTCRVTC